MVTRKASRSSNSVKASASPDYDIVFACDMAVSAASGLRVALEARAARAAGYGVGLLHLPPPGSSALISPEVHAAVQECGLSIIDPEARPQTRLLLLHFPRDLGDAMQRTARVSAGRTVVIADRALPGDGGLPSSLDSTSVSLAWTDSPATHAPGGVLRTERDAWPLPVADLSAPHTPAHRPVRIGLIGTAEAAPVLGRIAALAADSGVDVALWTERGLDRDALDPPVGWTVLDGEDTAIGWFLRKIDALLVIDQAAGGTTTDVALASALVSGMPVLLPPALKARYGDAALYAEQEEAFATLVRLLDDRTAAARLARRAQRFAGRQFSGERHAKRLAKLIGAPRRRAGTGRPPAVAKEPPRVLFVPKGGVGLGHVARTLAVARQARRSYDPVFVTLAESAGLVEGFGYTAEYIPSAAYVDAAGEAWEPWFQAELESLIDGYGARAVVFDGSDPPQALVRAVASRPGCRMGWMRRGMWEPGYDPSLHLSKEFDLIIEPGELAAERDQGATAARRHEAVQVAPITLLDRDDLLSREDAAAALGLDPARPSVLLQLGSGENRDILGTLDHVITLLREYPDVQIAVAEWANAPGSLRLWRDIKLLRGAPLSLYFNAFDFSIAAAGYNTFHEAIGFRLPTIFMPNTAPGMDDQSARARFAQERGAAIELPSTEIGELPGILDLMMKDNFREVMRGNCAELYGGNGAREASARIAALVH